MPSFHLGFLDRKYVLIEIPKEILYISKILGFIFSIQTILNLNFHHTNLLITGMFRLFNASLIRAC